MTDPAPARPRLYTALNGINDAERTMREKTAALLTQDELGELTPASTPAPGK